MTIFESSMSAKHFGRQLELPILQELGRGLVVVLSVYGILRFEDLLHRGVLRLTLQPGYEMYLFWLEILLSLVAPLLLLSRKKVRTSAQGLYLAAVLVVLGFITNRQKGCSFSGMIRYSVPSEDWCNVDRITPRMTNQGRPHDLERLLQIEPLQHDRRKLKR